MKYVLHLLVILNSLVLTAQSVTGTWKTIDDETGAAKSYVEIYENNGKIYGKIVKILNPDRVDAKCIKCEGANKNKPVLGMQIINGLTKDGDTYEDGEILNPENGKVYDCTIKLTSNPDKLRVRGYIGFFYKTQYWQRVK